MKKIPYKALLAAPYLLFLLGAILNVIVIFANGHQMPVYPPLGDCSVIDPDDVVHACMTGATHLKFLGDVFVSDAGVSSLGDWLMGFGSSLAMPLGVAWVMCVLKDIFKR